MGYSGSAMKYSRGLKEVHHKGKIHLFLGVKERYDIMSDAQTKNNYLASLKNAYNVNIYPQAISRDYCDKNHQSGAQKHWDSQIISQPGGVNPTYGTPPLWR